MTQLRRDSPRDSRMKNARIPFSRLFESRRSGPASAGLLPMLMLEGIVSISGGAGMQPFLPSFLLFFPPPLLPSPLSSGVTSVSNAGPLEVGYFIHLEYKAKVSPADHMPSLHARTRVHAHMVPSVHPRTLDVQQRLTYGISLPMYARVCAVYIART